MSRVSARAGITAYFTKAAAESYLPFVGTIYSARPVIAEETAYTQNMLGQAVAQTSAGSSAILVVNLPTTKRQRRADTGRGAVNDTLIHSAAVEIFFGCLNGDGLQAQSDYDGIVDSLTDLVRADPTFGGALWSGGEYTAGVDHSQNEPFTDDDGLTIKIVGLVRFEAWEWVAGNVTAP